MSARRPLVRRFWLSDWSLSALLALLVFNTFVLGPLALSQAAPEWLSPIVHSFFVLMGIATVLRSRAATTIVGVLAVASSVARWTNHVHPRVALERADSVLALLFCAVLAAVILPPLFSPGAVKPHPHPGAGARQLPLPLLLALAFQLV